MGRPKCKIRIVCKSCGKEFETYKYDIEVRGRAYCSNKCQGEVNRKLRLTKEQLIDLYEVKKLSTLMIGRQFGVIDGPVRKLLIKYNISRRRCDHVLTSYCGTQGDKFWSQEQRQAASDRMMKRVRTNPKMRFGKPWKSGKWHDMPDGRRIYFRSTWEYNYALYLNRCVKLKEIRGWEYESRTFWFEEIKRGVRSYTPDFKVITNDGTYFFVEVKGWLQPKDKTKLKRMKKYYPQVRVLLVDSREMNMLEKCYAMSIPEWEYPPSRG